ncbi:oligopeptide/dipeptide ABC transporter ATP-binding protein [Piscinibacter koreensis]|uniref:oligopeptide/dipeptide ABC transporter ATP-binding protein n=1 Tax=Piscinibacter koreensis TaxID=2742824 RepID=UPI001C376C84|nr:oligopeptide/dipeptide ABC transporter ATP-binding protein [Schlegelella koreensis]
MLAVDRVVKRYTLPRERLFAPAPAVHALRGVSLAMHAGRSVGLVGESGSGKSTFARIVMALERPTSGRVAVLGRDLNALGPGALRRARRDFQMVFQDPYGSLDPRQRVGRIVAEPLAAIAESAPAARVAEALDAVGLRASDAAKYPHEFSGGQRQRIAIARALITRPRLIVADEPVSALDVSVQAQVLNLLLDLQRDFGVTYLFISHDLAVVDHVCGHVAVMFAGRIVEEGPADALFRAPAHPYTRAFIEAAPSAEPAQRGGAFGERAAQTARAPEVAADRAPAAAGCAYATRCPHAQPRCVADDPALAPVGAAYPDSAAAVAVAGGGVTHASAQAPITPHRAACHYADAVARGDAPPRSLT